MTKYTSVLGEVSPSAKRVSDIIVALAPPDRTSTSLVRGAPKAELSFSALWPGVVGAVAGAVLWKKHPILGLIGGHAVGSNAGALLRGGYERKQALYMVGVEGAAIYGSLKYKRHPILGFLGGGLAGAAVTAVFSDSPARAQWDKFRR